MATVTITLPAYQNFSLALPQEALLAKFPESILGQALAGDPTATTIVIDNPLITPNVLQVLHQALTGQPLQPDSQTNWETVGNYLNLPTLGFLAPASLQYLRTYRPDLDIFRLNEVVADEYAFYNLMKDLVMANQPHLAKKLLASGNLPEHMDHLYVLAAYLGRPVMVALLQPYVNPREAQLSRDELRLGWKDMTGIRQFMDGHPANSALYWAIRQGHPDVVAIILKDPRVVLDTRGLTSLAAETGDFLSLALLVAHPTLPWNDAKDAFTTGHITPTSARILLSHPEANPDDIDINIGFNAYDDFDNDVVPNLDSPADIPMEPPVYLWDAFNAWDLIMTHPRSSLNPRLSYLFRSTRILPRQYINKWVFGPRFNPFTMPLTFYISLVWLWPLDILQRFIQTYPDVRTRQFLIDAAEEQYRNEDELINFTPNSPEAVRAILPEAIAAPPQPLVPR